MLHLSIMMSPRVLTCPISIKRDIFSSGTMEFTVYGFADARLDRSRLMPASPASHFNTRGSAFAKQLGEMIGAMLEATPTASLWSGYCTPAMLDRVFFTPQARSDQPLYWCQSALSASRNPIASLLFD
jgi:hypothetical protein